MTPAELAFEQKSLSRREFLKLAGKTAIAARAALLPADEPINNPEMGPRKIFLSVVNWLLGNEEETQPHYDVREIIANSYGRLTGLEAKNIHIDSSCERLIYPENISGIAHTYEMIAKGWQSFRNEYPQYRHLDRLQSQIFHRNRTLSVSVDDTLDVAGNMRTETLSDGSVRLDITLRPETPDYVGPHEAGHSFKNFFENHPVLSQQYPIWSEFQAIYFSLISFLTSAEADPRLHYTPNKEEFSAYLSFISREYNYPIEPGSIAIGTSITGKQAISTALPFLRENDPQSLLTKSLPYAYASTLLRYSILRDLLHFNPTRVTIENIMIGFYAWAATLFDPEFIPLPQHQCFTKAHKDVVALGHVLDPQDTVPDDVWYFSYISSSYLGPIPVQFADGVEHGQVISHISLRKTNDVPHLRPQFAVPELFQIIESWGKEPDAQNAVVEKKEPRRDPDGSIFQQLTVSVARDPADSPAVLTLLFKENDDPNVEARFGRARYFPPDQKGYPVPPYPVSTAGEQSEEDDGLSIEILLQKMGFGDDEIQKGMAKSATFDQNEKNVLF